MLQKARPVNSGWAFLFPSVWLLIVLRLSRYSILLSGFRLGFYQAPRIAEKLHFLVKKWLIGSPAVEIGCLICF